MISIQMNPSLRESLISRRGPVNPPAFHVTAIYETQQAGEYAKHFCDELVEQIEVGVDHRLDLWNFRVLGIPEMRNRAASDAASADMVIFSMDGSTPLTPAVRQWIAMWIWLIEQKEPAVVALFGVSDAVSSLMRAYLRGAIGTKNLDFFPRANCSLEGEPSRQRSSGSGQMEFAGVPITGATDGRRFASRVERA